jgi:uncharacterized repeat protein (TIGR03803 family)
MIDVLPRAVAHGLLHVALVGALMAGAGAVAAAPGRYEQVHALTGFPSEGSQPTSPVLLGSDGAYYGTTFTGGNGNVGTVFRMTSDGGVTWTYSFGNDGMQPRDGLVEGPDGRLYGTASIGGIGNDRTNGGAGVVFAITKQGQYTVLHNFGFGGAGHGAYPLGAPIFGPDGALYGATSSGGSIGDGLVWRLALDGTYTVLWDFARPGGPRGVSARLTLASDGLLYGTSSLGGNAYGTVFSLATDGSGQRILHTFAQGTGDGNTPMAPLIEGRDGRLYGTTAYGGLVDDRGRVGSGTVFTLTRSGTDYRQLIRFSAAQGGPIYPESGLVEADQDGMFYGTTYSNGTSPAFGGGTLFRMRASDGRFQVLHVFGSVVSDGMNPQATLVRDVDGAYLGTTSQGGIGPGDGYGTVFRWEPPAH